MTRTTKQLKTVVPRAMNQAVLDMARKLGVSKGTVIRNALEAYVQSPNPCRTPFVESRQGVVPGLKQYAEEPVE